MALKPVAKSRRVGHVEAPDAESAIEKAIREFKITDREQKSRLAARRVK
jgi:hypothetical protein